MPEPSIAELTADIADILEDVVTQLRRQAETLGQDSEEALAAAATRLNWTTKTLLDHAGHSINEAGRMVSREIRDHPAATTGAAVAAAAALVGLAIARQTHKPKS